MIKIEGMNELNRVLKNIPIEARKAVIAEMEDVTQDLKGESQRLAPLDTSDLRGSAYAEVSKTGPIGAEVGFMEPYALRQHEEVTYRHPKGGEAKYLEKPFKAKVKQYIKSVGDAVKRAVT